MLTKIDNTIKYGKRHGGFGIQILYPGLIRPELNDSGFSTIGRIDHARINPGTLIPMHPHQDDEIITYLRQGQVRHRDSKHNMETISNQRVMVMNAGLNFYHEEQVLDDGPLQGLQIFIRPESAGLRSRVQFTQLPEIYSVNNWRKIAGKGPDYPLQIRSDTWVLDLRLEKGDGIALPKAPARNCAFLFYVFDGKVNINEKMCLEAGESVLIENEHPLFSAVTTTDIVLLITQTDSVHFDEGMYSGNLQ